MSNDIDIIIRSRDQSGPGMQSAENRAGKLGKTLGTIGTVAAGAMVAGIAVGTAKAVEYFGNAVEASSNLNESVNAVQKIFGSSSQTIIDWGKKNANAFGLSRRAFQELATPLGAGLKNAGLNIKDTADWTVKLTERASDMASVFNTTVPDALESIQAGLRGEADPLEKYGVGLSQAKVQAQALSDTHKKSAKDLTAQELAMGRLNLIMKQTNSTAGDFKGTSTGLANSQRIEAAKAEELSAKIGDRLMPIVKKVTELKIKLIDIIEQKLLPAWDKATAKGGILANIGSKIADVFKILIDYGKTYYGVIGLIAEKMLPLLQMAWNNIKSTMSDLSKSGVPWLDLLKTLAIVLGVVAGVIVGIVIVAILALSWQFKMAAKLVEPLWKAIQYFAMIAAESLAIVIHNAAVVASALGFDGLAKKLNAAAKEVDGFANKIKADLAGIPSQKYINVIALVNGRRQSIQQAVGSANQREDRTATKATGGIAGGAATGGIRNGLTMVGEYGRELLELAPGSRVRSNPDTERMLSQGNGSSRLEIEWVGGNAGDEFMNWLKKNIRIRGGLTPALGS